MANFFFNEISLVENIGNCNALRANIGELAAFHKTVIETKHTPFLHREALYACQILGQNFQKAIANYCEREVTRKIRQLIDRSSPVLPENGLLDEHSQVFWNEKNIRNTALGECAARIHIGDGDNTCYSILNSTFTQDSLEVKIVEKNDVTVRVPNILGIEYLEEHLQESFPSLTQWGHIFKKAQIFLKNIAFENYVLEQLQTQPFLKNIAEDIYTKLEELNELASASKESFHELYEKYCVGKKAHFSGSSDSEKRDFEEALSFFVDGRKILCPFHGKVKNQQYRIHIANTPQPDSIARVVYIGPKLTKR